MKEALFGTVLALGLCGASRAAPESEGSAALTQPKFVVDSNKGETTANGPNGVPIPIAPAGPNRVLQGAGIAGADCIDFWGRREADEAVAPVVIDHPALAKALNSARSFSVTGWINREIDFKSSGGTQYLLNCPGHFFLLFGKWGRLCLGLYGKDGKRRDVWSSWISTVELNPGSRWVFFAVTWADNKAAIYIGGDRYVVSRDESAAVKIGSLSATDAQQLVIGAYDKEGNTPFKGMVDRIQIFADRGDSAALSSAQVETLRRRDLGPQWIESVRLKRAEAKTRQTERIALLERRFWSETLNLHQVDSLEPIFADQPPGPLSVDAPPISAPRNCRVALLFAVTAAKPQPMVCRARIYPIVNVSGKPLQAEVTINKVVHVPVEANNNGGMRTAIGVKPPARWTEYQTREAPFQVAEVVVPSEEIELQDNTHQARRYHGILLDIHISAEALPGEYKGKLALEAENGARAEAPFSLRVHKTVMPKEVSLHTYLWLMPEPENLRPDDPPQWWSEEHWLLLKNAGRKLREFYQDTINVPLIDHGAHALITTIREEDGSYSFDFARFDRWAQMFLDQGFRYVAGNHILFLPSAGIGATDHRRYGGVYALDRKTGEKRVLFALKYNRDEWLRFVPVFYKALYAHLQAKGWTDLYIQHQYDEPNNPELYKQVAELTRTYMPGVKTIDATKTKPEYSPLVDIMVFDLSLFKADAQVVAAERRARGKDVWFYHCASPYPPYPNRHLDEPLTNSRLYPWLAYLMNADGYLWWAVNVYRGADPYKTSVGPLPGGSQNPGHGPGDNWMYYPGPKGLYGGMRMVAFRDGLIDHTLLKMLAERDRQLADSIMRRIAVSTVDHTTSAADYHNARRQLLEALDSAPE